LAILVLVARQPVFTLLRHRPTSPLGRSFTIPVSTTNFARLVDRLPNVPYFFFRARE